MSPRSTTACGAAFTKNRQILLILPWGLTPESRFNRNIFIIFNRAELAKRVVQHSKNKNNIDE